MEKNSNVQLKRVLFTSILILLHFSTVFGELPEDDREDRIRLENEEKEWVNAVVRTAADAQGAANFSEDIQDTTVKGYEDGRKRSVGGVPEREKLFCTMYDSYKCEEKGQCDFVRAECVPADHLQVVACIAIYRPPEEKNNSTVIDKTLLPLNKSQLVKLECMQYQTVEQADCASDVRCEQNSLYHMDVGTCCCFTNECTKLGNIWNWPRPAEKAVSDTVTPYGQVEGAMDSSDVYWLIVLILLIIIVGASFIIFYISRKRKKETQNNRMNDKERTNPGGLETGRTPLVDRSVLIEMTPTKQFPLSEFKLISQGRFGCVFRAKWTDEVEGEKHVAVKKLKLTERTNYFAEKRIFDELSALPHWYPSIVNFVGAEQIGDEYWIVTEFHERLSLHELLYHNTISITTANRIILSMVDGLQFLHDDRPFYFKHPKPPVIHRDIKSKNILVRRDMTTCIADFGLARIYGENLFKSDLLTQVGTRRYMSPEMLESSTEYSPNAFRAMDVYSMGLVTWEVISRTKLSSDDVVPKYSVPYAELGFNPTIGSVRGHVVGDKKRPPWREEVLTHEYMKQMVKTTVEMWDPEAYARITAGYAFSKFWEIINNYSESSEGYHSSDGQRLVEEEGQLPRMVDDTQPMMFYHQAHGSLPHPTANPFNDLCPPPPPIPDLETLEIMREEGAQEQAQQEVETKKEKIYNVDLKRYMTEEEIAKTIEEEIKRKGEIRSGASTPTPSRFDDEDTFGLSLDFSQNDI